MKPLAAITAPEIHDPRFSIRWRIATSPPSPEESSREFEFKTARQIAIDLLKQYGISLTPADHERLHQRSDDRSPNWPDFVVGSITHKHSVFGVAIAPKKKLSGIGIDTEVVFDDETARRLSSRILTPSESHAELNALHTTLAFSAKEALYKALYPQVKRFFGFQAASAHFERDAIVERDDGQFRIKLTEDLSAAFTTGQAFVANYSVRENRVYTWIAIEAADSRSK